MHIQGYDNSNGGLSCLSDVKPNTDVLVVRRANTCAAGSAGCGPVTAGTIYFQATLCNASGELGSTDATDYFAVDSDSAALTKHQRNCTTTADLREMLVHIYFVANNIDAGEGDGIPTLKRWELGQGVVPLVEGIEDLQVEYGVDDDGDGAPDAYTADPEHHDACAAAACAVENWRNVTAVKINLLSRETESSIGYSDTKTYSLGFNADGSSNTVGPFNDAIRRHTYNTLVVAKNVSGRRER